MPLIDDERAIERRRRIAEMLMQQGQQPLQTNQMAGGYVVPVSPLAAIGKVAQQLSGAYLDRKADDKEAQLRKERASLLTGMDFNAPDAPGKLAGAGLTKEAVELAMNRSKRGALNSGTPGQWYVPPGAKEETFGGVKGFRLPDGSFIPSRAAMTEYQQAVTSPERRAAITAGIEGQKLHKFVDENNREGYGRGTDITGGSVPDLAPTQKPGVNMSVNIRPSMMQHLVDQYGQDGAIEEIKRNPTQYHNKEFGGGAGRSGPVMGPSMQDKAALDIETDIKKKQAESDIRLNEKPMEPLPVPALKLVQEYRDEMATSSSISSDLKSIVGQLKSGQLDLGPINNAINEIKLSTNSKDAEASNYGTFKATLEKIRNDSLRLNKGVQTEGDSVRAFNEIAKNLNNKDFILKRLGEIQKINERGAKLKAKLLGEVYQNYGKPIPDMKDFLTQPSVISGEAVKINSDDEYNALPSGAEFISPDGKRRRKP